MYLVMPLACVHHVSHVSDLVLAVITDVVHADQHRHNLPVLLEVQTLETQKHRNTEVQVQVRPRERSKLQQSVSNKTQRLTGYDLKVSIMCLI